MIRVCLAKTDCPAGWLATATTCFKVIEEKKTWLEAVKACQATQKAQLAFDFNQDEVDFLGFTLPYLENYWIGVRNK